jgi:plasmid replication initiation protein
MAEAILPAPQFGGRPVPYSSADFFICDIFDALPKGDLASMEHPLFSLSTRPDRTIARYAHNGTQVEVTPSVKGRATIHDKDILIYCISQLVAALNAGRAISRVLHLRAHDLLVATNRDTSGDGYKRLREAFERLAGTRITTNIVTGGRAVTSGFGLIDSWQIVRAGRGGRMVSVMVTLSDWLFAAVTGRSVLTLNRAYFQLRRPLERRLYEVVRKHCGRQPEWRISVDTLLKKSGSASPRRVFRAMLRAIIAADTMPDYALTLGEDDVLYVTPRVVVVEMAPLQGGLPPLAGGTLEAARDMLRDLAPGQDVYALEARWRAFWASSGRVRLRSADKAFLGWIKAQFDA